MTTKLNQIIAIEKGVKSRAHSEISDLHKINQKPTLFNGFEKKYLPIEEDGDKLPAESQKVQYDGIGMLNKLKDSHSELFEITARKDWTNMSAVADVVIDGKTIIPAAPVTFLLFLEKQLTDIRTFINNLPLLDASEDWDEDKNSGLSKTAPVQTHRLKKVQKPIVLYQATPEHPAQTQIITEDVLAGYWNMIKYSGAVPKPEAKKMLGRVDDLIKAVKQAREEANMTEEKASPDVGSAVFGYLMEA